MDIRKIQKFKRVQNICRAFGLGIFAAICGLLDVSNIEMVLMIDALQVLSATLIVAHLAICWLLMILRAAKALEMFKDGLIDVTLLILSVGVSFNQGILIGLALGCGVITLYFAMNDDDEIV